MTDWYERRHELEVGQVFRCKDGSIVRLDYPVPGDATKWHVDDWWNGWSHEESTIEPGDLEERLPDGWIDAALAKAEAR